MKLLSSFGAFTRTITMSYPFLFYPYLPNQLFSICVYCGSLKQLSFLLLHFYSFHCKILYSPLIFHYLFLFFFVSLRNSIFIFIFFISSNTSRRFVFIPKTFLVAKCINQFRCRNRIPLCMSVNLAKNRTCSRSY